MNGCSSIVSFNEWNEEGINHCYCHFCSVVLCKHIFLKGTENISGGKQSTSVCFILVYGKKFQKSLIT